MKRSRRILPAAAVAAAVLIAVSAAAMAAMPDNKTAGRESEAIALINNELAAAINDGGRAKAEGNPQGRLPAARKAFPPQGGRCHGGCRDG